jgi:hypothetical protein
VHLLSNLFGPGKAAPAGVTLAASELAVGYYHSYTAVISVLQLRLVETSVLRAVQCMHWCQIAVKLTVLSCTANRGCNEMCFHVVPLLALQAFASCQLHTRCYIQACWTAAAAAACSLRRWCWQPRHCSRASVSHLQRWGSCWHSRQLLLRLHQRLQEF